MSKLTWEDLDVTEYITQRRIGDDWPAQYVKVVAHEALIVIDGGETPAEFVGLINHAVILILDSEVPPAVPEDIRMDTGNDGVMLIWDTPVSVEVIESGRAEARRKIEAQIARLNKELEGLK